MRKIRSIARNQYLNTVSRFYDYADELFFLYGHFISKNSVDLNVAHDFLKQLNKKVSFISFEEACEIVVSGKSVRSPVACFSFDDGFEEIVTGVCPILKDMGGNACVFINPGFINANNEKRKKMCDDSYHVKKDPADWSMLSKFVGSGGLIGSHTMDHMRLSDLPIDVATNQIIDAKIEIENRLSIDCKYFAWPYGTSEDINNESLNCALENYSLIFSALRSKNRFLKNPRVLNREHFEFDWPNSHMKYFLSSEKNV